MLREEVSGTRWTRKGNNLCPSLAWVIERIECHSMATFFPGGLSHEELIPAPVEFLVKWCP